MFRSLVAFTLIGLVAVPLAQAQEKRPLVTHGRVQLNLAGAERIIEAARKKATESGLKCNVAVVDDGGHLLALRGWMVRGRPAPLPRLQRRPRRRPSARRPAPCRQEVSRTYS